MLRICFIALILLLSLPACSSSGKNVAEAEGAKNVGDTLSLPEAANSGSVSLEEALAYRRSVRLYKETNLTLSQISQLVWAAQGITEEKRSGRTAPSAGASYPLEVYVLWQNSLWHYLPEIHSLELRTSSITQDELSAAAHKQRSIKGAPACFIISAVHARTEHHYGNRAERYVAMEAGHACQNLLLQAVALDLGGVPIGSFREADLKKLLGLPDEESPLYIVPIGYPHPPRKRKDG